MRARLSEIAAVLGGRLYGADAECTGVSIDTRALSGGELFVALPGEHADGHDFLPQALAAGAAGALTSRDLEAGRLPLVRVPDTRRGLVELGRWWRGRHDPAMAAVTGSNGKTTVKEMLAAICRGAGPTLATQGNLNNELGVPLTLLRLAAGHSYAVIEMGANHPGEIAHLADLARPRVGVVTNAAAAHLEGFGSLEGVARAKGELFERLPADGVAVINADDGFSPLWHELAGRRQVISFSLRAPADVTARPDSGGAVLETPVGPIRFRPSLPGRHNLANSAAAAATALAMRLDPAHIREGLENVEPVAGRLRVLRSPAGFEVIDDAYNANPASLAAGIDFLLTRTGEPWLVLGEMAELGGDATSRHADAGRRARRAGVSRLFTVGAPTQAAAQAFGEGAEHFEDQGELITALRERAQPGVVCLVKGSRRAAMDRVVAALMDANGGNGNLKHASGGV